MNSPLLEAKISRIVEDVLNELDWKTYANAMKKAMSRKQMGRAVEFAKAASSAYMKKHNDADTNGYMGIFPFNDNTFKVVRTRGGESYEFDSNNPYGVHYTGKEGGVPSGYYPICHDDKFQYPDMSDLHNYLTGTSKFRPRKKQWTESVAEKVMEAIKRG